MSEWISCDERLPEMMEDKESQVVLVCIRFYGSFVRAMSYYDYDYGDWVKSDGSGEVYLSVEYWTPLPEVPQCK